jgi:broad specificity phosphatase PhoE
VAIVHLIRHARPTLTGVLLGGADPPLAAQELAPVSLPVTSIFCSPLRRARQTAEFLFPRREIIIEPALAEVAYGEWDGLAFADIERRWPALTRAKQENWFGVTPPGGEPWPDFQRRVLAVWPGIRAAAPCAVVAHSGVNAVLFEAATGRPALNFHQDYCEVISLDL